MTAWACRPATQVYVVAEDGVTSARYPLRMSLDAPAADSTEMWMKDRSQAQVAPRAPADTAPCQRCPPGWSSDTSNAHACGMCHPGQYARQVRGGCRWLPRSRVVHGIRGMAWGGGSRGTEGGTILSPHLRTAPRAGRAMPLCTCGMWRHQPLPQHRCCLCSAGSGGRLPRLPARHVRVLVGRLRLQALHSGHVRATCGHEPVPVLPCQSHVARGRRDDLRRRCAGGQRHRAAVRHCRVFCRRCPGRGRGEHSVPGMCVCVCV